VDLGGRIGTNFSAILELFMFTFGVAEKVRKFSKSGNVFLSCEKFINITFFEQAAQFLLWRCELVKLQMLSAQKFVGN